MKNNYSNLKKVYVVIGLIDNEGSTTFATLSEYGVKSTLEKAQQELNSIYNELLEEIKENGLNIVEQERIDNKLTIEYDNGSYEEYIIVESYIDKEELK